MNYSIFRMLSKIGIFKLVVMASSLISISLKTTGLPLPLRHHRAFRRRSVIITVTPSIALALAPSIPCRRCAVRRRHAADKCRQCHDVALSPPPHHRAAATALPPSCCAPLPQRCHQAAANIAMSRCCAVALPPPLRRCQAAADVALLRCRHRRSCCAAAAALPLPPLRCQAAADLELLRCHRRRCHRC